MLRALEMSESLHRRLFAHCRDLGIEFMSTAFDEDLLDFLVDLGIKRIKVPSGEITNVSCSPIWRERACRSSSRRGWPNWMRLSLPSNHPLRSRCA